ncbi:hypothetical protein A3D66_01740 [Candidatus Kaiserbacteria bacterium RIFCSPHIGHO2_02_FULL_50_9]|uniref:Uncharacterized protein n=1 Tax=Candidatus Kaiserbacteria bacterium RIFCSPLOWO2_01_FULL_51_21 TaxID=1798508 RepID=A0A1F6EDC5_9BACT|nr:MAG: hypothetical protein A2761_02470 [Candidatus Kaiserbacteria bacterium RIFCSPHIGHO2_01_FULL_51_33]OGG63752.1 MAG: hypothetical protein A3D66_01740 [Candidatus Kaiserbacteria bacterium RIFCSPHIGHO2_02_FULL_50_9]OGG71646.1 MAG: hypothetical protein A3A35_00560 [Candidatus Kaiserbacteria bacterium RIFCSPLOWO2_01_FULL_51_21]
MVFRFLLMLALLALSGCETLQCGSYGTLAYLQGEDRQESAMRGLYMYWGCRKVYEVARRDS